MKMKAYLFLFYCFYLIFDNKSKTDKDWMSLTTLDSLQGHWVSTEDSLWQLKITGRRVDDYYKDSDNEHEYFTIFFSDTLVDGTKYTFTSAHINTTATTGKYLVEVGSNDEIFCYEIAGFNVDSDGETFEYQATWTDKGPNIFLKQ
jgi:hypothetical protein